MRTTIIRVAALLACSTGLALAQAPAGARALSVVPGESSITYHLVHKLHKIDGTARGVEGKVNVLPDGRAQIMVRVSAEAFDSGNSSRDVHAKEAIEAKSFPVVELKGLAEQVSLPAPSATLEKTIKAQLSFHGVAKTLDVPVKLAALPGGRFRATASFAISLDGFKVERPSLLMVKVDDALQIDANLVLAP